MLETIGISKLLNEDEISYHLKSLFPKLEFIAVSLGILATDKLINNQIGFTVHKSNSEFPNRIEILFSDQSNTQEREQFIACKLSDVLNCKTIVGFQEKNTVNPYFSLVFHNQKVFLADDMETAYAGDGENTVKVIKEINYKTDWVFDEYGNLL